MYGLDADTNMTSVESSLSGMAFVHGLTVTADNEEMLARMREGLNKSGTLLTGVRIDTK